MNSGYERFTGRINTQYTANKWLELGLNLSGTSSVRSYNSNAKEAFYANPFYVTRYMAPVYPVYLHNSDGTYALDANGNKQYDTTSEYLENRNLPYEMTMDMDRVRRNVLDGLLYTKITLPYGFSLTGKVDLNHSNENRQTYNNPVIGDGASNNGRLTERSYQYISYTGQELLNWIITLISTMLMFFSVMRIIAGVVNMHVL